MYHPPLNGWLLKRLKKKKDLFHQNWRQEYDTQISNCIREKHLISEAFCGAYYIKHTWFGPFEWLQGSFLFFSSTSWFPRESAAVRGMQLKTPLDFITGACPLSPTLITANKNNYSNVFLKVERLFITINRQDSLHQECSIFKQWSRWF